MKLRNKKTGEVKEIFMPEATTLKEFCDIYEDYEVPKGWCVTMYGGISRLTQEDDDFIPELKEIGNYFNDKESAYNALEKLKAWKRLKDKGFNLSAVVDSFFCLDIYISGNRYEELKDDLKIVFGGKE